MDSYISTKWVEAEPAERDGKPGYRILYPDGYISWCPKGTFEKYYLKSTVHPETGKPYVLKSMVEDFIDSVEVTKMGDRVTVASAKLKNGFVVTKTSACVDPANFDPEIGKNICMEQIIDETWAHIGFLMSTAVYGIQGESTPDGGEGGAA